MMRGACCECVAGSKTIYSVVMDFFALFLMALLFLQGWSLSREATL